MRLASRAAGRLLLSGRNGVVTQVKDRSSARDAKRCRPSVVDQLLLAWSG